MKRKDKKLLYPILCFLIIFTIFIINLTFAKEQHNGPSTLLIGLPEGKIAAVNLKNWKIECLVASVAKSFQTIGIKYYSSLDKVIYIAFNFNFYIGIVDLKMKRVKFLNLQQIGYNIGIINDVRISLDKPEEYIYLLIAEKHLTALKTDEEWKNYYNTIRVICYSVKDETWEEIINSDHEHLFATFNEMAYFPDGKTTLFLQQNFAKLKKNRNDLDAYLTDAYNNTFTNLVKNQILNNYNGDSILYLGERYLICKRGDQIIVVDLGLQKCPVIINESPKSFIKTNGLFLYSCATELMF